MSVLPAHWTPLLTTRALGRAVSHYEDELTSTNLVLKDMARQGAPHGSLCLCETQTAGRGRLDRTWFSPAGQGIWLSVLLRPALKPEDAPMITFCAALAMARAVRRVTGLDAGIKWPNDLVLKGRKVCGILLEMGFGPQGMHVICGTGLNVGKAAYTADLADKAIALEECGPRPDRGRIIAAYLAELEDLLAHLEADGFRGIEEEYRQFSVTLGCEVRVIGAEEFSGVAEAVDASGALLVRRESGDLCRVLAGDVSVRGMMGYV